MKKMPDPIDICVLTQKEISHGDIILQARPIGDFRMIDKNQSDDRLIAVLNDDYRTRFTDLDLLMTSL